ncbi:MAG: hypothetical protein II644_06510 [Paludibacteraceae bacterium]|nr:hypothetical protein [Paludibacteraceae bacterium]
MKKFFIFAFALVAGALVFTSCEGGGNTPTNPTEIQMADYIGTNWRVDSCHWQGERTGGPHPFIKVISENAVLWWGTDTLEFTLEDGKISFNEPYSEDAEGNPVPVTLTIVKATKDFVHFQSITGMDIFMARIPDPFGTPVEVTEANILGTWKWEYNYDADIHDGVEDYHSYMTAPGVDLYTFKTGGILSLSNVVTDQINGPMDDMKWTLSGGKIRYCLPEFWDDPEAQDWYEVKFLSNESMVLYLEHNWGEVITTSTEYYTRVK